VDQYLELVAGGRATEQRPSTAAVSGASDRKRDDRAQRKELARLERKLEKLERQEAELHRAMSEHATDHVRIAELNSQLQQLQADRRAVEDAWLALASDE
jgi:ATP-binding cassette subfamily F protein uup